MSARTAAPLRAYSYPGLDKAAFMAESDLPKRAYPPPQILITLSVPYFLLEASDAAQPPLAINARDIEGLLAAIARWVMRVRNPEGAANV